MLLEEEEERVWIPPALLRVGLLAVAAADANAEALASARRFVSAPCALSVSISLLALPSKVILNLGESSCRILSSLVAGKGGLSIPGFGAIKSF